MSGKIFPVGKMMPLGIADITDEEAEADEAEALDAAPLTSDNRSK